ncbi:MAG: tryptophan-rich sensory protein [Erysipelotrichaceae bacterium]|nr:tryptophan-rich sensory protein [Erysipelotrichaceae bacterium]
MNKTLKNILFFLLGLFVYFLPSILFRSDNGFYKSLEGTFIPNIVFIIVWTILFAILSFINTYLFSNRKTYDKKEFRTYFILMFINYVFIFLFPLGFFVLENLFLGYLFTLFTCVTAILLSMQVLLLNKRITLLYIPYILWTTFATIYSIMLYLKN